MVRLRGFAGGAIVDRDLDDGALEFIGPDISTIVLIDDLAMLGRDFSALWTSGQPITYTLQGSAPPGVTLTAAGVLQGTPTVAGDYAGLTIRADDGLTTEDSNVFQITVVAAGEISLGLGDGALGDGFIGGAFLGGGSLGA